MKNHSQKQSQAQQPVVKAIEAPPALLQVINQPAQQAVTNKEIPQLHALDP